MEANPGDLYSFLGRSLLIIVNTYPFMLNYSNIHLIQTSVFLEETYSLDRKWHRYVSVENFHSNTEEGP